MRRTVTTVTDDAEVRQRVARIEYDPFIPVKDSVRGFVDDASDGSLREVDAA